MKAKPSMAWGVHPDTGIMHAWHLTSTEFLDSICLQSTAEKSKLWTPGAAPICTVCDACEELIERHVNSVTPKSFWAEHKTTGVFHLWDRCGDGKDFISRCNMLASEDNVVRLIATAKDKVCEWCRQRQEDEPVQSPRILNDAIKVVYEDREKTRGHPRPGYELLTKLWSSYLGVELTLDKTIHMLTMLKIARDTMVPEHDNLVDIAGYAENLARCRE